MDFPVVYRRKVRFSDSDAQGVVFNANYLAYWDDTITDYFEATGVPWAQLTQRGFDLLLAHAEVDFRSAGRIGQTLATGARVARIGTTSLTFELRTWEEGDDRTVVEGRQVQVIVDAADHRPVPVPSFLSEAIGRLQGDG